MRTAPVNSTSKIPLYIKSNSASLVGLILLGTITTIYIQVRKCKPRADGCENFDFYKTIIINFILPGSINVGCFAVACFANLWEQVADGRRKQMLRIVRNFTAYTGLCVGIVGIHLMTRFLYSEFTSLR